MTKTPNQIVASSRKGVSLNCSEMHQVLLINDNKLLDVVFTGDVVESVVFYFFFKMSMSHAQGAGLKSSVHNSGKAVSHHTKLLEAETLVNQWFYSYDCSDSSSKGRRHN